MKKHPKSFDRQELPEIYQFTKENVEGFSCLLNYFITELLNVKNGCIFNVSNTAGDSEDELISGHLYFYATSKFANSFTTMIRKAYPQLKTLNIIVNMSNLREDNAKKQFCREAFSYVGIKEEIKM